MIYWKEKPQFDSNTGKPIKPRMLESGWVCDYCGKKHDAEEDDHGVINYLCLDRGESEPYFHTFGVPGFPDIDIYKLMNENPDFTYCVEGECCEAKMLREVIRESKKQGCDDFQLCIVMLQARLKMIARVLIDGTFTRANLGL